MNANQVYNETVELLKEYNTPALMEIAYTQYAVNVEGKTRDEVIAECALVEVDNFSK